MAVKIQWQPPLVLEERKKAQWEKIIRYVLGELDDALTIEPAARGGEPALASRRRIGRTPLDAAQAPLYTRARVRGRAAPPPQGRSLAERPWLLGGVCRAPDAYGPRGRP
jgi:hypothetical protein